MNNQNYRRKKVNQKPKRASGIATAVCVALLVIIAAVFVGIMTFDVKNPNQGDLGNYFETNEHGDYVNVITDEEGNSIQEEVKVKNQVNFLVAGKDRWAFNTDVIIIVSYNIDNGQISLMQIPRDTYIEILNDKGKARGNHKVNSLLASFYNDAVRNKDEKPVNVAMDGLKEALSDAFGIPINYYVMLDLEGFVKIVDALDGVEVNVPFRMKYNDPEQNLNIDLKPGLQTLDGDKAEQFIRFRADYIEGDIGRVDAQKIFIGACIEKVKKNFNLSTITKVAEEVMRYVITDIPLQNIISYAKSALSVDLANMTMMTLPGIQDRQYGTSGAWYYITSHKSTVNAINKYFNPFTADIADEDFDSDGLFYDAEGTYMHSIYLKEYSEESYSPENADDITIHKYKNTVTTKATTTTEAPDEEPVETTDSLSTDEIAETTEIPETTIDAETTEVPSVTEEPKEPADE